MLSPAVFVDPAVGMRGDVAPFHVQHRPVGVEGSVQGVDRIELQPIGHVLDDRGERVGDQVRHGEHSGAGVELEPEPVADEEAPAESTGEVVTPVVPEIEPLPENEVADEVVEAIADEKPSVAVEEIMPVVEPKPITGGDELNLSAEEESWAEIVDANDIRLFYGMIRPGRALNLVGQAPFDVFLGNAPAVSLSLNSIAIDMTKYIRSNNIAQFKISVEEGRVRFH